MRTSFLRAAILAVSTALLAPHHAEAEERPLIWEFRKNSDTFYAARFGSRLPLGADAGIGAEVGMRGPDFAGFSDPVLLWARLRTEGEDLPGTKRTTRFELRSQGIAGTRRLSVENVFSGRLGLLDAEFTQNHTFHHAPSDGREIRIDAARSIRISSADAGTVLVARAARAHDAEWRTSVGVERKLNTAVKLRAGVEQPGTGNWKGMFGASYNHRW